MERLKAVIVKEFIHIRRDPRSLVIIFALPLVMIFIFGHVLSFDLKKIETLIIDLDRSPLSRDLITRFAAAPLYKIYSLENQGHAEKRAAAAQDYLQSAERWLRQGKIKQYLIIPRDFSRRLAANFPSPVAVVIDGADANVATRLYQYNERIFKSFFFPTKSIEMPFEVKIKMFFNPEIASTPFIIPGLVAALMLMISALLTSLSLAREKETGSIELLFISPLRSPDIILGKTIPYLLVALIVGLVIFLFSHFFFGLQVHGSLLVLFLTAVIYILTGLSLGILISTVAPTQKVAMLVALLGTILPSIFLSGFIFPLESLSPALRAFSYLVPATYFLRILRSLTLKGASLRHFLFEASVLLAISLFLLALAIRKFSTLRRASA